MTNNIQCSIESSTTKIELNSAVEGVFLVPELEGLAGLPEIRTTSGVNAGYDGGWTSAQNYDARLISIRGVIANPDVAQVEAKRRAIASLLGQGRKEQLTLRLTTEAGNSYAISVRTISCEMALQRVLTTQEFLIQLRADDPLIYDDGASAGTEAILRVQRALGGFEINFELPLAIGGGAESTIVENGEEMVYPIIKLYGPLHSPTVVNTTTNQQMQLNADLQYTVNWSGYENEEGSAIAISDGIENAPMSLTQLDGNATQTTYTGKNLLNLKKYLTDNGVSYTENSDGSLTFTLVQAIHSHSFVFSESDIMVSISATITNGTSANAYIELYKSDGTSRVARLSQTVSKAENVAASMMSFNWGTAGTVTVKDAMLNTGSTALPYEPYVGGTSAPNPEFPMPISTVTGEQTIKITGKNLLDNSTLEVGTIYSSGAEGSQANRIRSGFVAIPPNTRFVLSGNSNSVSYGLQAFVFEYASADTSSFIRRIPANWTALPYTYTTSAETKYMRVVFSYNPDKNPMTLSDVVDAQLEVFPNLLNPDKIVADSNNAQTYLTNGNEWIHFKTGGVQMKIKNPDGRSGAFSLSAIVKSADATTNVIRFTAYYTDGTNANIGDVTTTDTNEHTVTGTTNASKTLDYIVTANTYAKDALMKIAGSYFGEIATATTYVPYQGMQTQEVNLGGTNLWSLASSYTNDSTGSKWVLSDTAVSIPAGTYTFSSIVTVAGGSNSINCKYADGVDNIISIQHGTATVTFTEEVKKVALRLSGSATISNIQLEKGSQATPYVPYTTYQYELAKIGIYRDKIYFDADTSKWYIQKNTQKLKLLSTNNWSGGNFFDNAPNLVYFYSTQFDATLPNISAVNENTSMASFAKPTTSFYTGSPASFFGDGNTTLFGWDATTTNTNRLRLAIASSFLTGGTNNERLASWKSQLDVNDFYIIAPLMTPTDTEITEDTLLAQLNAIRELYQGVNNISLVPSAGAQGTMEIQYATEYTIDQDVAVIDSQARTITINGQDAYHLKTDESEFLLLAPGENKLYLTSASDTDEGYAEVKFKQGYLSI